MATPKRKFAVRYFFIDPKNGQVLVASKALLDGITSRRRHIPEWAGMRIRMVEVIARVSGSRLRVENVKGCFMHFADGGFWDRAREAETAMAFMELASRSEPADEHDRQSRRFAERRAQANRWHVGADIVAAIQADVERGRKVKGRPPWLWAPSSEADSEFE
jgi:hypothetical protein